MIKEIKGGVTEPLGFLTNSLNCGIKRSKHDLAILFSQTPAIAFAVFTQNKAKAAPVIISQKHIKDHISRAIIANSGNANSCNGKQGLKDAQSMASLVAKGLNISTKEVLVASTGVIGKPLPIRLIKNAIPDLIKGLDRKKNRSFAKAIMTTDKFPKEAAVRIKIGASIVSIGGVAKGAGMINPNMATMLSFITTDAAIMNDALEAAFGSAVDKSFNSITIDGATSTNDCVFILANGLAGNRPITKNSDSYSEFSDALGYVMSRLSEKIVSDGEGATKLVHITVKNAKSFEDARKVAMSIANNTLFKTSVYGEDPNWGRIVAAAGSSGADVVLDKLDIYLGNKKVLENGTGKKVDKEKLKNIYQKKNIKIIIDLKKGKKDSQILTCDLTKKYIDINASYTT